MNKSDEIIVDSYLENHNWNYYVDGSKEVGDELKKFLEHYLDKVKQLKVCKVTHSVFIDAPHALLDGHWISKTTIVKVGDLEDINKMFERVENIKIIEA